jgi:anthranilate synthase/phosphoribosyltransferase
MILMIDNYDSFTFNLVQALEAAGAEVRVVRNDAIDRAGIEALADDPSANLRGIVVSPGPSDPEHAGVSRDAILVGVERKIPTLGVCLGMQSMGAALGATIRRAPTLVHGEASRVRHDGRGLLAGMPTPFMAARYHSLSVAPETLPPDVIVTARTEDDHVVMGIRHTRAPVEGVQFHPESVLTPEGPHLLANFLRLAGEGEAGLLDQASGSFALAGFGDDSAETEDAAEADGAGAGATPARSRDMAAAGTGRGGTSMSDVVRAALVAVVEGKRLSMDEARAAMGSVMDGEATPAQLAALLVALRMRGETVEELAGFASAMRDHAVRVQAPEGVIDTCGTGGDGSGTINISTAAALVVAAAGVPVAKHGNRAITSKSGSADVLEALGISTDLGPDAAAESLRLYKFAFLFAGGYHPAMRHAGPTRKEIGVRTAFNLLGPMTNPAGARRQVMGVGDSAAAPRIAEVLRMLGAERALVVHGTGLDELPLDGSGVMYDVTPGGVTRHQVVARELGLMEGPVSALVGGTAAENAAALERVLDGAGGPGRDVVLLNAAAAFLAAGRATNLREGIALAAVSIDSGAASRLLGRLRVAKLAADEAKAAREMEAMPA